ncbi:DUF1622 domain-containing protein [Methanobacterium paludis]|uniref:DUF1622 domain-containing protein n=1 Tax=Methanobacterium paludis (strain DSM 25820 / JCM 18151 / SWAN1) TaxID=868131 RepID=UPI000A440F35|nr:DUF1622 domain-containing protein [Methanobacterium paludis]
MALIFYGGIRSVISLLVTEIKYRSSDYSDIRTDFTSKIVLALEFFIAADLIKTILQPTLNDVIILAVIVSIRTVVGYFLDKEAKELVKKG